MLPLYIFVATLHCLVFVQGAPIHSSHGSVDQETLNLEASSDSLRILLSDGEDVEVYDKNTLLLYKPEAVYQIHIPQVAGEAEEDTLEVQPPYDIINMLESDQSEERITLDQFTELTGIKQNAKEVFNDWDLNGDGFLDQLEILREDVALFENR